MLLDRAIYVLCREYHRRCKQGRRPTSYHQLFKQAFPRGVTLRPNLYPGLQFESLYPAGRIRYGEVAEINRYLPNDHNDQLPFADIWPPMNSFLRYTLERKYGRLTDHDVDAAFGCVSKLPDLPKEIYFYMVAIYLSHENFINLDYRYDLIASDVLNFLVSANGVSKHYSYLSLQEKYSVAYSTCINFEGQLGKIVLAWLFHSGFDIRTDQLPVWGELKYGLVKSIILSGHFERLVNNAKQMVKLLKWHTDKKFKVELIYRAANKFDDFEEVFSQHYWYIIRYLKLDIDYQKLLEDRPEMRIGEKKFISVINSMVERNREIVASSDENASKLFEVMAQFKLTEAFYLSGGQRYPKYLNKFSLPSNSVLLELERKSFNYSFGVFDPGLLTEVVGIISQREQFL